MDAQLRVDHRARAAAHGGGADRMEDAAGDRADSFEQGGVILSLRAGPELLRRIGGEGRLADDRAGDAHRLDRDLTVLGGGEIIGADGGRGERIGGMDPHIAAAVRAQVADAGGEGGKGVERAAERGQAQGLDMIFEIGGGMARIGFDEHAELAGRHRQWPGAAGEIVQAHPRLAQP